MGLRTWVRQRLGKAAPTVDLLEAPVLAIPAPKRLGLDLSLPAQSWSVARLAALFRDAAQQPSASSLQAARVARHRLSMFWLSAPVDALEALYDGPLGELQRQLLEGPLVHQDLALDERQWRDQLAALMVQPGERSRLVNLLLALMPYTRPGKFQLMDAVEVLPQWLLLDYAAHCEPDLKHRLEGPAGLLSPGLDALPVLSDRRGQEVMALLGDPDSLRRVKALIKLFGIAPEDAETLNELSGLRQMLAQLWLDVDPDSLEQLYRSSIGEMSQSLIQAGFGAVLVDADDDQAREQLKACVEQRDISAPEHQGLILAAMLYFPLDKVSFDAVEGLPAWLVEALRRL